MLALYFFKSHTTRQCTSCFSSLRTASYFLRLFVRFCFWVLKLHKAIFDYYDDDGDDRVEHLKVKHGPFIRIVLQRSFSFHKPTFVKMLQGLLSRFFATSDQNSFVIVVTKFFFVYCQTVLYETNVLSNRELFIHLFIHSNVEYQHSNFNN